MGTTVVLVIANGAVPIAKVEVICPVALRVEKAPVLAVPLPIAPGAANVAPPRVVALIVPEPLTPKLPPVPMSRAFVLVPAVSEEKLAAAVALLKEIRCQEVLAML